VPGIVIAPLFYSGRVRNVLEAKGLLSPALAAAVLATWACLMAGVGSLKRRLPTWLMVYASVILGFHVILPLEFQDRFLILALPLVCLGVVCGVSAFSPRRCRKAVTVLSVAAFVTMNLSTSIRRAIDVTATGHDSASAEARAELRELSAWLRTQVSDGGYIVTPLPEAMYLRTGLKAYPAYTDHGRLIERKREDLPNARFLVGRPLHALEEPEDLARANGVGDAKVAWQFRRMKVFSLEP
jgi:hypothetical protein